MQPDYMIKFEFDQASGNIATDEETIIIGFSTQEKKGTLMYIRNDDQVKPEYISVEMNNNGKFGFLFWVMCLQRWWGLLYGNYFVHLSVLPSVPLRLFCQFHGILVHVIWMLHTEQSNWQSIMCAFFSKFSSEIPLGGVKVRMLTLKVLVTTIDAQWKGMGDVGSARYEPALLPPCPTIRVLSYSN